MTDLLDAVAKHQPDKVLMFGERCCRRPRIERCAMNFHAGFAGSPKIGRIEKGGRWKECPPTDRVKVARERVGPGMILGRWAGWYVCNDTFYRALRHSKLQDKEVWFVHVPQGHPDVDTIETVNAILREFVG